MKPNTKERLWRQTVICVPSVGKCTQKGNWSSSQSSAKSVSEHMKWPYWVRPLTQPVQCQLSSSPRVGFFCVYVCLPIPVQSWHFRTKTRLEPIFLAISFLCGKNDFVQKSILFSTCLNSHDAGLHSKIQRRDETKPAGYGTIRILGFCTVFLSVQSTCHVWSWCRSLG